VISFSRELSARKSGEKIKETGNEFFADEIVNINRNELMSLEEFDCVDFSGEIRTKERNT